MKKMAWFGLAMLCGTLGGGTVVRAQEAADVKKPLAPEAFLEIRRLADPRFSPDGSKVAFVVSEPITGEKRMRHIWLHDRTSDTTRQLTYSTKSETSPRWSPDGKSLAFLSSRGEEQQIYLLPMTGGEAHAVTKGKAGVQAFAWSPDGKQIAYLAPEAKTEAEEKKEKDKDDARVVDKDEKHARIRLLDVASGETSAVTVAKWEI
jgi:Tol biopolymer transport system component